MSRDREVRRWLFKAMEDLRVAQHELMLPEAEVVTTAVCFHCQQFIEKGLKAFLVAHGKDFPRTHNLGFLKALCAEIERAFEQLPIEDLSLHAVEFRYPGSLEPPTLDEARQCLQRALRVKEFLEGVIGIPLESVRWEEP